MYHDLCSGNTSISVPTKVCENPPDFAWPNRHKMRPMVAMMRPNGDPSMSSFQQIYDSAWHHPGVAFVGSGVVLLWALWRRPPALGMLLGLQLLMIIDALCTGGLVPIPHASGWGQLVPVFFVVQGDARFYFLLAKGRFSRRKTLALALLAGLFVPLSSYALQSVFPELLPTRRHLFLTHELLFCGVVLSLLWRLRSVARSSSLKWQRRLCLFELLQYGLWVLSDVVILCGMDIGFALRLVPNLMYYVLFVPFALTTTPAAEART